MTARRCGLALAAGAILALAAASAVATARQTGGPEGDDPRGHGGKRKLSAALWEGWGGRGTCGTPPRWLVYSRDSFQRIMWMLADRSAELHVPETVSPRQKKRWPGPPGGYEPIPARWPDVGDDDDDGEERPRPAEHRARCHRAGAVVQGGSWYVVRQGDTLWSIAEAHYGDGRAWRRILRANWRTVPDASCIYACQRLYIPPPLPWEGDRPPARQPWSEPDWRGRPVRPVRLLSPRGCSDCGAGSHAREGGWR